MSGAFQPAVLFLYLNSILMCNVLNGFPASSSFVLFSPRKFFSFGIPKPLTCEYTYSCDCCCIHIFCVCVCVYITRRKKGLQMWEYATKRKKKRSSLNQPDSLPLYLSQLLRRRRKSWSPLSRSFSSALKEFCQPTPGVGPRFSFQSFLSYFFVVTLNIYLLFFLLNERKKEKNSLSAS